MAARLILLLAVGAVLPLAACQTAPTSAEVATGAPAASTGRYGCSDGDALSLQRFPDRARVVRGGGFSVNLPDRRPESGLWFADDRFELRGGGPELTFGRVGEDAVVCRPLG